MLWLFLPLLGNLPKPDAVTPKSPSSLKAEGFLFAQLYHWVVPLGAPLLCHSSEPKPLGTKMLRLFLALLPSRVAGEKTVILNTVP